MKKDLYKTNELTQGKTSVFITHRLGSVLYSDLILFFQDGEIVESGTHEELVARRGKYYEFWSKQYSLYMSLGNCDDNGIGEDDDYAK